jgi:hypothetical protein
MGVEIRGQYKRISAKKRVKTDIKTLCKSGRFLGVFREAKPAIGGRYGLVFRAEKYRPGIKMRPNPMVIIRAFPVSRISPSLSHRHGRFPNDTILPQSGPESASDYRILSPTFRFLRNRCPRLRKLLFKSGIF